MHLYRANRMERLLDALADVVAQPLSDALAAECIAVPSAGMERFVSMELAKRLGVWANPAFPFPRRLIEQAFAALLPSEPESLLVYEPSCMRFALARLLREAESDPALREVAPFLRDDQGARRRLSLAERLADLFDQYGTYRPEMLLAWEQGQGTEFQAHLFRSLSRVAGPFHMAARAQAFVRALAQGTGPIPGFPERVTLFGLSTLPPLYVHLLSALAQRVDVHLFLLSPSREYFADLRSRDELLARARRQPKQASFDFDRVELDPEEAELASGHPLLAALGRNMRELQQVLLEHADTAIEQKELYVAPGHDSVLQVLLSDMLALRARGGEDAPRLPWPDGDDSVRVHACHGPMREVEVLHDELCRVLEDPVIEPHDIIVMVPDVEAYAPLIDAVFSESRGRPRIPFRIADRGALHSHRVVAALDAVLDVLGGRFESNPVLDLLGHSVIRERFEITAEEVETLRGYVADAGIRWAVDAEHRSSAGQPAVDTHTFRFGLARLALGYALPEDATALCFGRAALPVEPSDGALLGRFFELCERLFALRAEISTPATLAQWHARTDHMLRTLFVDDATTAHEHKLVRRATSSLADAARRADFDEAIEGVTFRAQLMAAVDARAAAHGFLSGGVTFCQLVPMRSIPFSVVCLLGMNDGDFPSSDAPLGFDLMAQKRKIGDRSRREDDRQLFLEALLSTRKRLLVTYVGQSLRDGKALSPSVLVTEVLEQVARSFVLPGEVDSESFLERVRRVEARLLLRHPQKAWNPRYFDAAEGDELVSYAQSACSGARALVGERAPLPAFLGNLRPTARPELQLLALRELEECLMRPCRTYARRELGLRLGGDLVALADREPLQLDALERWQVGDALLADESAGLDGAALLAQGLLPEGKMGKLVYRDIEAVVRSLRAELQSRAQGQALPRRAFELEVGAVRLSGRLGDLYPGGQVRAQFSKLGSRHELRHWLRHLVLSCLHERGERALPAPHSVLIGRGDKQAAEVACFPLVRDAHATLQALIELYALAQTSPLPLFESASRTFMELLEEHGHAAALARARQSFEGGSTGGDLRDPYVGALYRDFDEVLAAHEPLDFAAAASRVYGPLLQHRSSS